jgi:hypothetical protein
MESLSTHIRWEARDVWQWRRPPPPFDALSAPLPDLPRNETLSALTAAMCKIKYEDGQDPHSSIIAPGVIVLPNEGLTLADEVNRHKRNLARILVAMQGRTELYRDPVTHVETERPLRELALEKFFYRRLHHWQATRELTVLRPPAGFELTPEYIGFTWASLRDIRRTSREELLKDLQRSDKEMSASDLVQQDIAALQALPAGEPIALVRSPHPTPKANIAWPAEAANTQPRRASRIAVLPLLMTGDRLPARFRKLPPAPTPPHFRLTRSDTEIEPSPFLTLTPAHRYLPTFREEKRRILRARQPVIENNEPELASGK